jgi:cell division protein FtsW
VQKFNYLPEQIGDSIFAVEAEEFGLVGSITLILIYLFFAYRGFKIAGKSADSFGGLLTVGIVILIISQSFNNIASMLGVAPLSGSPLLFVSQGGTALMVTLAEVGIIFNISKYKKSKTA